MKRIRTYLSYANVISTLALFGVLGGGTALAAVVVTSNADIAPDTVAGHSPPTGAHSNVIGGSINGDDVAKNGIVACWGSPDAGATSPPAGTFTALSGGYSYSCGVRTDGRVTCWGDDSAGQTTVPPDFG